ncbi:MAG TPA: hypothetical protein VF665_08905 [Longimicrobium sp.]|uniref:hypothetical protein n=1 Tax=Longimicrobium sp. TaxID=2029185 RepID=UPI002EDB3064
MTMNLHRSIKSARHAADRPLFPGPVACKYRRPRPEPSEEVFRDTFLAAFWDAWPLEIDDVFPANQTAGVDLSHASTGEDHPADPCCEGAGAWRVGTVAT